LLSVTVDHINLKQIVSCLCHGGERHNSHCNVHDTITSHDLRSQQDFPPARASQLPTAMVATVHLPSSRRSKSALNSKPCAVEESQHVLSLKIPMSRKRQGTRSSLKEITRCRAIAIPDTSKKRIRRWGPEGNKAEGTGLTEKLSESLPLLLPILHKIDVVKLLAHLYFGPPSSRNRFAWGVRRFVWRDAR
jgi:hypothetical protein